LFWQRRLFKVSDLEVFAPHSKEHCIIKCKEAVLWKVLGSTRVPAGAFYNIFEATKTNMNLILLVLLEQKTKENNNKKSLTK
jgi:hypothetical protein